MHLRSVLVAWEPRLKSKSSGASKKRALFAKLAETRVAQHGM